MKRSPARPMSSARAARLYRLIQMVSRRPRDRTELARRLNVDLRAFFRDLKTLRTLGIHVEMRDHRYCLQGPLVNALTRLPMPDPGLTIHDAMILAKGRTSAHRKLKEKLRAIIPRS